MQAALAQLAATGADAGRIADLSVSTWRDVDSALSPIVGQDGVAALYKRSLYLKRAEHPSLAPVYEGELGPGQYTGLHSALSQLNSASAAAANGALLQWSSHATLVFREELRYHAAQPAIARVVMKALVPVLLDRVPRKIDR